MIYLPKLRERMIFGDRIGFCVICHKTLYSGMREEFHVIKGDGERGYKHFCESCYQRKILIDQGKGNTKYRGEETDWEIINTLGFEDDIKVTTKFGPPVDKEWFIESGEYLEYLYKPIYLDWASLFSVNGFSYSSADREPLIKHINESVPTEVKEAARNRYLSEYNL